MPHETQPAPHRFTLDCFVSCLVAPETRAFVADPLTSAALHHILERTKTTIFNPSVIMDKKTLYGFEKDDVFSSWAEFSRFLKNYENSVRQNFTICGSRTIEAIEKKRNISSGANKECKYDYVKLECKFAKPRHDSRGLDIRFTRTCKFDCPAFIRLTLTEDEQKLKVHSYNFTHEGHDGSEEFYKLHRENRAIKDNQIKEKVNKLLSLKVPVSSIQDELSKEHGIEVIAKDVQNMKQRLKDKNADKLSAVVATLEHDYQADVQLILSDDGEEKPDLKGSFFSTMHMRDAYLAWPKMVFTDGKYNMLKNKMITILMCVQDGEGHSHIIGVGLIASEDKETLKSLFTCLKSSNPVASAQTKIFMTDNDLTERAVIKEVFPDSLLLICEFHILKIFMRRITTTAMQITTAQRYAVLELLDKMVKSNSEEEFNFYYNKFMEVATEKVKEYFNNNYYDNKNEWVRYYMSLGNNGNYTNYPVESQNARLGKLCPHPTTFVEFIKEFFAYQERKNTAMKHSLSTAIYTRPVKGYAFGTVLYLYENILTKKAFAKVAVQYDRRTPMTFLEIYDEQQVCWIKSGFTVLKASTTECDCINYKSDGLPCRHIFAVRGHFNLPLFDKKLCPTELTTEHAIVNHPTVKRTSLKLQSPVACSPLQIRLTPKTKTNNFPARLRKMQMIASSLVNVGSVATNEKFDKRCALLRAIEEKWRNNEEVSIGSVDISQNMSNLSIGENNKVHTDQVLNDLDNSIIMPTSVKVRGRPSGIHKSTIEKSIKKKK